MRRTLRVLLAVIAMCVAGSGGMRSFAESEEEYSETEGSWVRLPGEIADRVSASNFADALLKGLSYVELKKGYVSPIGQKERAMIVKSVTARHGYVWVPRKLSTVIGRLEELLGYVKKIDEAADAVKNAFNLGKIIGIAAGADSLDEAVDLFVSEGMYQNSPYGEAAYWIASITTGMMHGRSFTEAIIDGYDVKNAGLISKLGFAGGSGMAWLVQNLPWKVTERERADRAFLDSLIAQGLNEEGQAIVRAWLKLDVEQRARFIPKLGPEFFDKPAGNAGDGDSGAGVCDGSRGDLHASASGAGASVAVAGPCIPYSRMLFLFSGDHPTIADYRLAYESAARLFTGESPLLNDVREYEKMCDTMRELGSDLDAYRSAWEALRDEWDVLRSK